MATIDAEVPLRDPESTVMPEARFSFRHYVLTGAVAILIAANALSPYLGLKWEYSFTMFSNLKTDGSNHLFMPAVDLTGSMRYYVVERLEIESEPWPRHARLLRTLLEELGHPAVVVPGPSEEPAGGDLLPVHRDLIAFHISRLNQRGIRSELRVRDARNGESITITTPGAPREWLEYGGITMRYPIVLHDYQGLRKAIRDFRSREGRP